MAKKKGITPTTALGGPTSTLGSNTTYTGGALAYPTNTTTGSVIIGNGTTGTYITTPNTIYQYPTTGYIYTPPVTDGFYEEDGKLFWKNSQGEIYQLTFTKKEVVNQILNDL